MKYASKILLGVLSLSFVLGNASIAFAGEDNPANVYHGSESTGYWGDNALSAEDEGETKVSYSITSSFTIEIPAMIEFAPNALTATGDVVLHPYPKLPGDADLITVQPASDWQLSNSDGTDSVYYDFGTTDGGEVYDTKYNPYFFSRINDKLPVPQLIFKTDGTVADERSQTVIASIESQDDFQYAGDYTDPIIWTVAVVEETPTPGQKEGGK
ncbi:MAG: hypothetical protein LBT80_00060 [Lactobacillaceae bacterium]|jgi:hypothetical protein|nr:hypothetical protein [Lactobacillaceae bacterium]